MLDTGIATEATYSEVCLYCVFPLCVSFGYLYVLSWGREAEMGGKWVGFI